jgi:GH15 family glucan-1,4-alpha-glucosidase
MMHKYQPDRSIGSTWHPLVHDKRKELAIQEDETASVIFMLGEYYDYSQDKVFVETMYSTLIQPAANFMHDFIDEETNLPHASYDLWEEKFLTSTYTVSITIRALKIAADFAETLDYPDDAIKWRSAAERIEGSLDLLYNPERQAYRKGLLLKNDGNLDFDNTIDASSLYGVLMFTSTRLDDDYLTKTAEAVNSNLLKPVGGYIRYEEDWYMRASAEQAPNPWHVCSLWMAQFYMQLKQADKAKQLIDWSIEHSFNSGALSEQINPITGYSVGVTPLVWSHAELVNAILDYTGVN